MGSRARVQPVGVQHRPGRRRAAVDAHGWDAPAGRRVPDRGGDRRALPRAARRRCPRSPAALRVALTRGRGHPAGSWTSSRTPAATRRRSSSSSSRTDVEHRLLARAVIDASGTWTQAQPARLRRHAAQPASGPTPTASPTASPTCSARDRDRYAGKRVLVVGSGHSAFNAILDLVALRDSEPATEIVWAIRGGAPGPQVRRRRRRPAPGPRRARRGGPRLVSRTARSSSISGFHARTVDERRRARLDALRRRAAASPPTR